MKNLKKRSSGLLKTLAIGAAMYLLTPVSANAKNRKLRFDSLSCLVINGRIENAGAEPWNNTTVELWLDNRIVDSLTLENGRKKFRFVLSRNAYYTVRIRKQDYADKLVCINTTLDFDTDDIYKFSFSTRLIESETARRLNPDVVDFPVAIIHYHEKMEGFYYNKNYTMAIRHELYSNSSVEAQASR